MWTLCKAQRNARQGRNCPAMTGCIAGAFSCLWSQVIPATRAPRASHPPIARAGTGHRDLQCPGLGIERLGIAAISRTCAWIAGLTPLATNAIPLPIGSRKRHPHGQVPWDINPPGPVAAGSASGPRAKVQGECTGKGLRPPTNARLHSDITTHPHHDKAPPVAHRAAPSSFAKGRSIVDRAAKLQAKLTDCAFCTKARLPASGGISRGALPLASLHLAVRCRRHGRL